MKKIYTLSNLLFVYPFLIKREMMNYKHKYIMIQTEKHNDYDYKTSIININNISFEHTRKKQRNKWSVAYVSLESLEARC